MSCVYLFPLSVYLIFQITFILTYIAALLQGHVVPNIPYISDAATYSPESCFFGQLINIGCVLLGITIYIRYRQIVEIGVINLSIKQSTERLNRISVWIGVASCFGISVVANFQETNVRPVHLFGALLCFGFGTVYFCMQTILTYYLHPYIGSMLVAHIRLLLSLICTVFFFLVAIPGIISHIKFDGNDPRHWYPSDGGWLFHVVSSVSEWIVATSFSFYILTFTPEFKDISVNHPQLNIVYVFSEIETMNITVETEQDQEIA